jgi:NTE family protein
VHIWNPHGSEPQAMHRQKDMRYSSPAMSHVMRHVVSELVKRIPESERQSNMVRDLAEYGCLTRMHVVRLLAPTLDGGDYMKAIDFSAAGICARWEAGLADARAVIAKAPWQGEFVPIEGVILHEARAGTQVTSGRYLQLVFRITVEGQIGEVSRQADRGRYSGTVLRHAAH